MCGQQAVELVLHGLFGLLRDDAVALREAQEVAVEREDDGACGEGARGRSGCLRGANDGGWQRHSEGGAGDG